MKGRKKDITTRLIKWLQEAQDAFCMHEWQFSMDWGDIEEMFIVRSLPCNMEAHITANYNLIRSMPEKYVRQACFHEVAHALLSEFMELACSRFVNLRQLKNANERLAERLARLMAKEERNE